MTDWDSNLPVIGMGAPGCALESIAAGKCGCHNCIEARKETAWHMVVCPECGNKRCPKANNHGHLCTRSNEPGQPGSAYA